MKDQAYRASVGALIYKKDDGEFSFLLVRKTIARRGEYDFAKGGMNPGENFEDALKREISEERGNKVVIKINKKSDWNVIHEWPQEFVEKKGFRGQARISFWSEYLEGEIILDKEELDDYKWVEEANLRSELEKSGYPEFYIKTLIIDWESLKESITN